MKRALSLLFLCAIGCGEAASPDAGPADAGPADASALDASLPDASLPDASLADAGEADAGANDAGASTPTMATVGPRCGAAERAGVVTVGTYDGVARDLSVTLFDAPPPWIGDPEARSGSCVFHRAGPACMGCGEAEACAHDGRCVEAPVPLPGLTLTIETGGRTEELTGDGSGSLFTMLPPGSEPVRLRLRGPGFDVEVPPLAIPPALGGVRGQLAGSTEAPGDLALTWTPPAVADTTVFTNIDINHHVREPTFTRCAVVARAGSLMVPGAMLAPLAVVTGLEFQGLEHVVFAATETPHGCLEFRFTRRIFVSL
jgi:hypothetical protein